MRYINFETENGRETIEVPENEKIEIKDCIEIVNDEISRGRKGAEKGQKFRFI